MQGDGGLKGSMRGTSVIMGTPTLTAIVLLAHTQSPVRRGNTTAGRECMVCCRSPIAESTRETNLNNGIKFN